MVLQGLARQIRLQDAMRKDVIVLGGFAFFYMNADHMILQRTEQKLTALGLYHQGNMTPAWTSGSFENEMRRLWMPKQWFLGHIIH